MGELGVCVCVCVLAGALSKNHTIAPHKRKPPEIQAAVQLALFIREPRFGGGKKEPNKQRNTAAGFALRSLQSHTGLGWAGVRETLPGAKASFWLFFFQVGPPESPHDLSGDWESDVGPPGHILAKILPPQFKSAEIVNLTAASCWQ